MSETAFYLDQLAPLEALILLSEACQNSTDNRSELEQIYLEPGESVFGHTATLILPDLAQTKSGPFQNMVHAYRQLKAEDPGHMAMRQTGLPLSRGLAWLLLHADPQTQQRAQPNVPESYLLMGKLSANEAAETLENLRFHATHTRVAASPDTYLFHVLDDDQRASSFQAALAGDQFANLTRAIAYDIEPYTLFLPCDLPVCERALDAFLKILIHAPTLIGRKSLPEKGLLAAITHGIPGQTIEETSQSLFRITYLGNLHFQGQASFKPGSAAQLQFDIDHLEHSQQALDALQEALHVQAQDVGYQLQLRPMRQPNAAAVARMRLLEQQSEINTRLAYLESVSRPRPVLIRFRQDQLSAMATLLRAFPLEVLRNGAIRYAFQATQPLEHNQLLGYHFLFIEPQDAVMRELDPLLSLGNSAEAPDRFWLDPLWARYYHDQAESTLVFVPQNSALFPAMHGWSSRQMDGYLREVMFEWFGADHPKSLPHKPIYLFEGCDDIQITVLDRDQFLKLYSRLGWINDHLTIHEAVGVEQFVKTLATDIGRHQLAEAAAKRAQQADAELENLLHQVNRQTARKLSDFTDTLNQEFNQILNQTEATAQYLRQAFDYLTELTKLGREAQGMAQHGFQTLVKTEGRYRDLTRFVERLEGEIDRKLNLAERQRGDMVKKITRGIDELTTTHEQLSNRLADLLRFRK